MKKTQLFSFLVLAGFIQSSCMNKKYYNRSKLLSVDNKEVCKKSKTKGSLFLFVLAFQLQSNTLSGSQKTRGSVYSSRNIKQQRRYYKKQNRGKHYKEQNSGGGRYGGHRGLSGRSNGNMKQKKYGKGNR